MVGYGWSEVAVSALVNSRRQRECSWLPSLALLFEAIQNTMPRINVIVFLDDALQLAFAGRRVLVVFFGSVGRYEARHFRHAA